MNSFSYSGYHMLKSVTCLFRKTLYFKMKVSVLPVLLSFQDACWRHDDEHL